jgi:hypothetical protein
MDRILNMKRTAGFRITGIILAVTISICCATFAWAEGTTLICDNVTHQVTQGQSLSSIAAKVKMTPAALMAYNGLTGPTLRPKLILHIPMIKQVAAPPDKPWRIPGNPYVKAYQIYTAQAKCYAMVYAAAETEADDEQFLAVFVFEGKAWKEVDRIDFTFPVSRSNKPQMKLLTPDKTGNESCCFYQEYIMSSKEVGADGIVFVPAISQHLHGASLVFRAFSYGAQKDEGLPPYEMESENIGHPWPDRLLYLKANIMRKLDLELEPSGN